MESTFIKSANLRESSYGSEEWKQASDYISKSRIKNLKESPDHFKNGEPFIETPEIIFGRGYHHWVFQESTFTDKYYVFDDSAICDALITDGAKSPRATKDYKIWLESEMSFNDGKIFIQKEDFERMQGMKNKLINHSYARMLIINGIAEQAIMGELETEIGRIGAKLIPDQRNDKKRICIELKTTRNASREEFPKEAANYDYHIDAAFYSDLLELFYGDNRPITFIFIAQEKRKPYTFNIFEATPQFIAQGRYEYEMLLQLYKYCLDNNYWPGYQVFCENKYGILQLKLPSWSIKDLTYYDHIEHKQPILTN
jgi:exodeoxyribonuclease VIII